MQVPVSHKAAWATSESEVTSCYLNVASRSNLLNVRRRCRSRARSQERQSQNVTEDHDDVPQAADLLVASCAGFYIITANGIIMAVRLA